MEYKGYKIEGDGTFGYSEIKPIGKGSVHLSLRGSYTTPTFAMKHIDAYLEDKDNVKAKTSDRV